ncbi:hypothetical protein SK128_015143 [Halocaridina rubra]|uniref:Uncharacterized protein n=1 Tax=Halocaridina rubra TaxID=373956 RepID=A0AAN8X362_HALRR
MATLSQFTMAIWILMALTLFILSDHARAATGHSIKNPLKYSPQINLSVKSPTLRRLTWWRWGNDDEEATEATSESVDATFSTTSIPVPVTTEAQSRWRSWFTRAKDKLSRAAKKVKDELIEAKESYSRGLSYVGSAAKEGFKGAGRAIKTGAKKLGNATLTAGRAIKAGAKSFGTAIKRGYQKIRLKFSGENEKFKIVANRLKEKLEEGDERAKILMEKLGINITYSGDKILSSQIANKNISVTEVLRNEGMLSNKSVSYYTAIEQPEIDVFSITNESNHETIKPDDSVHNINGRDEFYITETVILSENNKATYTNSLEVSTGYYSSDIPSTFTTAEVATHTLPSEISSANKTSFTDNEALNKYHTAHSVDKMATVPSTMLENYTETFSSTQTSSLESTLFHSNATVNTYSTSSLPVSHSLDSESLTSELVEEKIILTNITHKTNLDILTTATTIETTEVPAISDSASTLDIELANHIKDTSILPSDAVSGSSLRNGTEYSILLTDILDMDYQDTTTTKNTVSSSNNVMNIDIASSTSTATVDSEFASSNNTTTVGLDSHSSTSSTPVDSASSISMTTEYSAFTFSNSTTTVGLTSASYINAIPVDSASSTSSSIADSVSVSSTKMTTSDLAFASFTSASTPDSLTSSTSIPTEESDFITISMILSSFKTPLTTTTNATTVYLKTSTATTVPSTSWPTSAPTMEEATYISPDDDVSADGSTFVESEPYVPPPFPDIFSDIEVHHRLREFYDQGDFSHAEMVAVFNFDPDNYEYYDYTY